MEVGFIGLGAMGSAMARRLLEAGHRVRAWNRSSDSVRALSEMGAVPAKTVNDALAAGAAVTMLADDEAVRSVLLDSGALSCAPSRLVHIVAATISVSLAKDLERAHAEHGLAYVAAPVLGRPDVAAQGKLDILAAGDPSALACARPLLDAIGKKTWVLGDEPHKANVAKIAANLMLASALETMAEAITLARRHELDPHSMMAALTGSIFSAPVYRTYGDIMLSRRFEPALFKTSLGFKDIKLAVSAGEAVGVPLPVATLVHDALLDAIAHGQGNKDWATLATVSARRAGIDGT